MNWSKHKDAELTDLVFQTDQSVDQMAKALKVKPDQVRDRIKYLELEWVQKSRGNMSRGHAALVHLIQKLLPDEKVVTEYHIGNRLRLDIYCPTYKLAAEYHGRQHFQFVKHFHKDKYGFLESQKRDDEKLEKCKELGIALMVFRYCDKLSEEVVFQRMLDTIKDEPVLFEEKVSRYKGNSYYEKQKERNREFRRKAYREMKARRKNG